MNRPYMSRGRYIVAALLLVAATVLVYSRAMKSPFQFDDEAGILLNPSIQNLRDIGAVLAFNPELPRPLLNLSLAMDYRLHGFNQFGYHLTNLFIHLLCAFLVWWLAAEVNRNVGAIHESPLQVAPILAAFIFALHPIATEPTIYIWSRSSSMMTAFCLASAALYIRSQQNVGARHASPLLALSLVAFVFAVLSKEEALTFPLLILAVDWILFPDTGWLKRIRAQAAFWILPVGALIYRLAAKAPMYDVISWRATEADEFSELVLHNSAAGMAFINLFAQLKVGLYYAMMLFFPTNQSVDHGVGFEVGMPSAMGWAGIIFTLIMAAVFVSGRKRWPRAALAIAFFFVPLSIFYVIPVSDVMVERRLYLPLAGFAIWLGATLVMAVSRIRISTQRHRDTESFKKNILLCVSVPLCLFLFFLAFNRSMVWRDRVSLWSDAARVSPEKLRPRAVLARNLYDSGNARGAIRENLAAIRLKENYGPPIVNLGLIYLESGDYQTAEKYFRQALHWHPGADFSASYNLGITLARSGRPDEAIIEFKRTIYINPGHALARVELGKILAERRSLDEAAGWFREALGISPDLAVARMNLGNVLLDMGRRQEGIRELELAAKQAPDDSLIWYNLGWAYFSERRYDDAEKVFRFALKDKNRPEALFGMAQVKMKQNKPDEARLFLQTFLNAADLRKRPELAPMAEEAKLILLQSAQ